jgi:hypothetical protein
MGASTSKDFISTRNAVLHEAISKCGPTSAAASMSNNKVAVRAHSASFCGGPVRNIGVVLSQRASVVSECSINHAVDAALKTLQTANAETVAGVGLAIADVQRVTASELKTRLLAQCEGVHSAQEMRDNEVVAYTCGGDAVLEQVGTVRNVCMLNSAAKLAADLTSTNSSSTKGASMLGLLGLDPAQATIIGLAVLAILAALIVVKAVR